MDIDSQFRCDVLIGGVERGDEVAIPDGKFVIKNGDMVSIIASPANSAEFFRKIGIQTNQVRNTMIVGGGTIAYYLAKLLAAMKIRVKIVEKDKARCEVLTELLDDALILNGDGTDRQLLLEEGLMTAEAFVTLTNMDEENVFLALYAKENSSAKLVTKVNRIASRRSGGGAGVCDPRGVGSDGHSADEFESQEQPADRMHQPRRQYQDRAWTGLHPAGRYSDCPDEPERSAGYP